MAKYSLWILDDNCNRFCVPLSRDGQNYKEKVELYEIDLLTVSLGKQKFIQALQNSHIAPNNFDWNSICGHIEYKANHKDIRMPLIFEKDDMFIEILNFYNQHCYHQKQTATKVQEQFLESTLPNDFQKIKSLLIVCRDRLLDAVYEQPNLLYSESLPKEFTSKLHRYMHAVTLDEQVEYRNDLLKKMFSYINFRRVKALEYGCYVNQRLIDLQQVSLEIAEEEVDPDRYAFLTEDEKLEMEGYTKGRHI